MSSSTENIQNIPSQISSTQDDHPKTQFIWTIVIHNYTAKLTNLLFNNTIVHQIRVDIFGIDMDPVVGICAWVNYAPVDQDIMGMVESCPQIDLDILEIGISGAYYTGSFLCFDFLCVQVLFDSCFFYRASSLLASSLV